MLRKSTFRAIFLATLFLASPAPAADWVPGILHIHTTISGGHYTVEEIAQKAHDAGMKIVFISDHDLIRFEYGVWPFRDLIKVHKQQDAILRLGAAAYLEEIRRVDQRYPDMLVFAALESTPFYYWQGAPWEREPRIIDSQKHLFVAGLEDADAIENLPILGGRGNREYRWTSLLRAWPLVLVFLGWRLSKIKKTKRKQLKYFVVKKKRSFRIPGYTLMGLGVLAIVLYFPFKVPVFDPYHGDQGAGPYQALIDYVNARGALAFWAHPEPEQHRQYGPVKFDTAPYPEMLLSTRDYTGFASLYEGYRQCASPGGYWDQTLNAYRTGRRDRPAWTIGELDFHVEEEGSGKRIDEVRTYFLLETLDRDRVLQALRQGQVYASRGTGEYRLVLEDFSVRSTSATAVSGGELLCTDGFTVHAALSTSPPSSETVTLRLIKNGQIAERFQGEGHVEVVFEDTLEAGDFRDYFRIDAATEYPHRLFSNPIFVRRGP